jgi:hypothetical protein
VRVRSNLITLRVKTSQLQEYRGKTEALNLTTGFRLSYTQIKNCEDSEVPEMVVTLPITTMVDTLKEKIGAGLPLKRQPSEDAVVGASSTRFNSTVDGEDDDKIWEYLYAETDDAEADEADLYEYR